MPGAATCHWPDSFRYWNCRSKLLGVALRRQRDIQADQPAALPTGRCRWRPLRLIQPGTALAKKLDALGCEHEDRAGMALRRRHVTPGDKPLQVAFLIAGKLG
jgi:hypothetical protein